MAAKSDSKKPYPITPAVRRQRSEAAVKHGLYATRTAATRRARRLRHRVARLKRDYPQLAGQPRHLIQRYAEVDYLAAELWTTLEEQGAINKDGEPKRLLSEY